MLDGEWLKMTREFLDLTMEDVANEMFSTKQCISDIEKGKTHNKTTIAFYERILIDHLKKEGKDKIKIKKEMHEKALKLIEEWSKELDP